MNLIDTQNQFLESLYRLVFQEKAGSQASQIPTHFKLQQQKRQRKKSIDIPKVVEELPLRAEEPKPSPAPVKVELEKKESASTWMKRLLGQMTGSESPEQPEEFKPIVGSPMDIVVSPKDAKGVKETERKRKRKEKKDKKDKKDKNKMEGFLDFVDQSFYENLDRMSGNPDYFKMDNYIDIRVPTHLLTSEHLISFDPETQLPRLIQIYTDFTTAYGEGEEVWIPLLTFIL
jgi:hypothetical protein